MLPPSSAHDADLPIQYLAEVVVFGTEALAAEAARSRGGYVLRTDGAWLAVCPVEEDMVRRAEAATWDHVGTFVLDPEGTLPPAFVPED